MEMGEIAAATLIELLTAEEPKITKTVVLDHKLIVRKSSLRKESLSAPHEDI
jgi:DNA-binding LacI/PurR family transcriptional regulator